MIKVSINGKEQDIESRYLDELTKDMQKENLVTIVNGYATSDNVELHSNDEIFIIEKGKKPSKEEFERMLCARHTPKVYEKVKKAKVVILGLGGLGSNIAISLARTGVGHLHLVDFDVVEPSNLNRQQYRINHLGMLKTEALKEEISEINPFIKVTIESVKVTDDNVVDICKDYPIICEAFDNPAAKSMLVNAALTKLPLAKVVSASGMAGFESSNTIVTRKVMNRLYLCGDGETGAQIGRGLMAPRVSICAGHEANMILRLILGEEEV